MEEEIKVTEDITIDENNPLPVQEVQEVEHAAGGDDNG